MQPLRISTRKGFWRTLPALGHQLLIVCQKVTLVVGWLWIPDLATAKQFLTLTPCQDHLDDVAASPFISTLDLNSGYYQIPGRKEDKPKTAIITHKGKFQFTPMPFGFKGGA